MLFMMCADFYPLLVFKWLLCCLT